MKGLVWGFLGCCCSWFPQFGSSDGWSCCCTAPCWVLKPHFSLRSIKIMLNFLGEKLSWSWHSTIRISESAVFCGVVKDFVGLVCTRPSGVILNFLLMWHLSDHCFLACNPLTEVTVVYQNGLPVISVSLPSRRERCQFTLKPLSDCVGVFLQQLQAEDRGIDRVAIYSTGMYTNTNILCTHHYCIHLPQQVIRVPYMPLSVLQVLYFDAVKCSCSCGFASEFNTTACTMKRYFSPHSAQRVYYTGTTGTWKLALGV